MTTATLDWTKSAVRCVFVELSAPTDLSDRFRARSLTASGPSRRSRLAKADFQRWGLETTESTSTLTKAVGQSLRFPSSTTY